MKAIGWLAGPRLDPPMTRRRSAMSQNADQAAREAAKTRLGTEATAVAPAEAAAKAAALAEELRAEAERTSPPPPKRLSFAMERYLGETPVQEVFNGINK
ncbi:predicted protein [Verticillium alfalfae VaMs.102]|uniref:Predicted protein n=1 Tax=Verticillium alfalfae (strain VaMs.102 / ATCC MYA-4576 / FGSC 10136) TaxID=526221 RepID=C9SBN7_VERA1|nr:predicted protein [Verticillium alfalfae VaMs.102]EEY15771.1 predicted protein [Verticillium alfalfae VaMs.102]